MSETQLQPSDFVEVRDMAAEIAAEGELIRDPLSASANSFENRVATAERYGSSHPAPVDTPQAAQTLQDLTSAETALAEAQGFALPNDTPAHKDFLTPMPERPGSAEDRQRTRLRIEAMNAPRELSGLAPYATAEAAPPGAPIGGSLGVEFSDAELDAYAVEGRDPVAEMASEIIDRDRRSAERAIYVAKQEQEWQSKIAERAEVSRAAYQRQAEQAIEAARARGADESWIQFALTMRALPGHPDTGR